MRKRLDLNGPWQFRVDRKDEGETCCWFRTGLPGAHTVEVPHIWQRMPEYVQYCGTAWYEKSFSLDNRPAEQRLFLCFGAVDFSARVWVNGRYVGGHEGGFTPFEFDITAAVNAGLNRITVRVFDPQDNAEIPIGKQGSWYTRVSGIWQDVWLEWRSSSFIRHAHVFPDIGRNTIRIKTALVMEENAVCDAEYVVTRHLDAVPVATTVQTGVSGTEAQTELAIPNADWWFPESPHLYDLEVRLKDPVKGTTVDVCRTTFGMRSVAFRDGQLFLNDRPLYIRGALDQAYYPDTIYAAPSDEWIQREIRLAKEMGFNLLRKHIKAEIPRYLYWADRMGMLIWAEPPNTVKWSAQSRARFLGELKGMIERDLNHPSIIIWTLYNEEWGLEWDLANDPQKQEHVRNLYDEIKRLDPTRLICDNSGWIHVKTDINDYHRYFAVPEQIEEWKRDIAEYMTGHPEQNFTGGSKPDGQPIIVSEFGVWGLPSLKTVNDAGEGQPSWFDNRGDDTHREDFKQPRNLFRHFERFQVNRAFGDLESLTEASQRRMHRAVKSLIEEMRKNPGINGYVVTEFTDVEWETNGWLDFSRNPKAGMDRAKDFNGSLVVMVDGGKRNLWCGEEQILDVVISNHDRLTIEGTLFWELAGTNAAGTVELKAGDAACIRLPGAIRFAAPEVENASFHLLKLKLVIGGEIVAQNEEELTISPVRKLPAIKVCAYGMPEPFRRALRENGAILADSPEEAQAVVTDRLDETVSAYCLNGGHVLFLAEEGDRLAEKGPFTFRELARGESWERASSFNYVDTACFAGIPLHPEMGWEFEGLFPDYIVPISNYSKPGGTVGRIVYMFGNESLPDTCEIISGYFQGWIGQAGASLLTRRMGRGRLTLATWKLKDTYGSHPIATQIVHALLGKAIDGN